MYKTDTSEIVSSLHLLNRSNHQYWPPSFYMGEAADTHLQEGDTLNLIQRDETSKENHLNLQSLKNIM